MLCGCAIDTVLPVDPTVWAGDVHEAGQRAASLLESVEKNLQMVECVARNIGASFDKYGDHERTTLTVSMPALAGDE